MLIVVAVGFSPRYIKREMKQHFSALVCPALSSLHLGTLVKQLKYQSSSTAFIAITLAVMYQIKNLGFCA